MVRVETIFSDLLGRERDLYIFTPPGYRRHGARTYPVLYLQDGQNVFSREGTWPVRWDADGTAARLIRRRRIEELIIVGIANSEWRDDEYTPTEDALEGAGGLADLYLRHLVEEVKPFIDGNFRVRPFREDTAIGGSSLGGLLALYAAMTYPHYFSKVAALSPSLWWDDQVILKWATEWEVDPAGFKLWLDMGWWEGDDEEETAEAGEGETEEEEEEEEEEGREEVDPVDEARVLCDILVEKGFRRGRNLRYFEDADGTHDELAWGRRFGKALTFLFGRGR